MSINYIKMTNLYRQQGILSRLLLYSNSKDQSSDNHSRWRSKEDDKRLKAREEHTILFSIVPICSGLTRQCCCSKA